MNSFRFDHVRLHPAEQIGLHHHPTWELSYIVAGNGRRVIGDTRERFKAGEIVLVPPDMPHHWAFDDDTEMIENITVAFSEDFVQSVARMFPEMASVLSIFSNVTRSCGFTGMTRHKIARALTDMCSMSDAEKLVELLRIFNIMADSGEFSITGTKKISTKTEDWLKEVDIYVRCNYKKNILLDDVANHMGMSRSSFCTAFRRHTGKTFITYLNKYRMNVALYLLSKGGSGIAQVCYQSGFNDVPYFNRLFKRINGMTPSEYSRLKASRKIDSPLD